MILTVNLKENVLEEIEKVAKDFPTRNSAINYLILQGLKGEKQL